MLITGGISCHYLDDEWWARNIHCFVPELALSQLWGFDFHVSWQL
jgi:hypothetical protein